MPVIGAPTRGERNGGPGNLATAFTVTTAGRSVIVMTASIDPSQPAPTAITGIPGISFTKIGEGPAAGQIGFLQYRGAPTIWKADDVPAGSYALEAVFASSTDLFGCIVALECTPCAVGQVGSAGGAGTSGALPPLSVESGSLVLGLAHSNPNLANAGFVVPSGWSRVDARQDGQAVTSFDSASLAVVGATTLSGTWNWSDWAEWGLAVVELVDVNWCRALVVGAGGVSEEMQAGDTVHAPGNGAHSALDGLQGTDHHPQYMTEERGDQRYATTSHAHALSALTASGAVAGDVCIWDGVAWVPARVGTLIGLTRRVALNQIRTLTALAEATELSMFAEANGVYLIDVRVSYQSAATTTGINLGLRTPAGCRNLMEIAVPVSSGAASNTLRTIFPNASVASNAGNVISTGVSTVATTQTARISGILVNGATAGPVQVMFATEVANSAVTLMSDSQINLTRIA